MSPFDTDWATLLREAYEDGYRAGHADGRLAASTEITYESLRLRPDLAGAGDVGDSSSS